MIALITLFLISISFFILAIIASTTRKNIANLGLKTKDVIKNLKYLQGHPDILQPRLVNLALTESGLILLGYTGKKIANINFQLINEVVTEDWATFEKRNFMLIKEFSKKSYQRSYVNSKDKTAFLSIFWSVDNVKYQTIFTLIGSGSTAKSEEICNSITNCFKKEHNKQAKL